MFRRIISVCVLSLAALPLFAADKPDPIEADLTAAVAKADKTEEAAKDVLRAAHVRTLKLKIEANEAAIRRLTTKAASTKDADAKAALEARAAELTFSSAKMTEEASTKVDVVIASAKAAPTPPPVPAAVGNRGMFSHVAGIWVPDRFPHQVNTSIIIIADDGTVNTVNGLALLTTTDRTKLAVASCGTLCPSQFIRQSETKMRYVETGNGYAYGMTRITAAVPPATMFTSENTVRTHMIAYGLDAVGEGVLRKFVKEHPLK